MAKEKFQKYIISLDAVDVGLLPINYQCKFDDVAPLWTTNNLNMRNNDYYEFEIKNVETKIDDFQIMAKEKFQKYIISLDAVDVGLLPINYQCKFDDVAPLWTTNNLNMRNNDYYEFEIKNVETKIDDDPVDEIINIPCHICNVDVPVPYLKQHHDSFKHLINMKIADTAVERIKKSMHQQNFCNNETHPSLYFCPACVAVIKLKDKTSHEKSIAHKNSLIVNKFLNDFYILYTDNTNCDDYDVHLHKNNLNQSNDHDVKKDANDNVDYSIDSLSFRSATDSGSIFKECDNDISDRNKVNNSTHSDTVKTIINNNEEITSENCINVSNSVEGNNRETVEDTTLEDAAKSPKVIKKDTKKKKSKIKNNAGTSQDLVCEDERNQITRQSPISLASVDDVITGEVSKNVPEVIKTEKGKTKKGKTKNNKGTNEDIVQNSKEQDNNGINGLSFFGDDTKVDDIFKTIHEVVNKENSKTKKAKTKKGTNEKTRSTNSSSFFVDDLTVEASEKPAEVIKTEKNENESKEKIKLKDMNRENENKSCKICNNDENKDHSVCIFLWNELCERFNKDNEINNFDLSTNDLLPFHIFYHLIMKCDTPYCMVCKVNFYGDVDIITHLLSKGHMNSYKALISDHFLILDNDVTICKVCDVKFKREYELIHCEDIKHITRQEKHKRQLSKMN